MNSQYSGSGKALYLLGRVLECYSPEFKLRTGRLVLRWVTTWESRPLYALLFEQVQELPHPPYSIGAPRDRGSVRGLTSLRFRISSVMQPTMLGHSPSDYSSSGATILS